MRDTFRLFIKALERLGYQVQHRELRACDYGAPTIRKRFFLIARCDGRPIVWPEPTHGKPDTLEVQAGLLKPWRTAAEIIDWSIPCPSIFERKKPLSENTLRRIARGIQRFVIEDPEPFIVRICQTGFSGDRAQSPIDQPLNTIVSKNEHCLVSPTLIQMGYGERNGQAPRVLDMDKPLGTITAGGNKFGVVAAFLSKYYGGGYTGPGVAMDDPVHTITAQDHHALVCAYVTKFQQNSIGQMPDEPLHTVMAGATRFAAVTSHIIKLKGDNLGHRATEPLHTITAGGLHLGEVRAFLIKYYGQGIGQGAGEPLHTIKTHDVFGLVMVHGEPYAIADIGMRMLEPRELFLAQGFRPDYIINRGADGRPLSKAVQVARCGNAVPPAFSAALVEANLPEMCRETRKARETER